MPDKYYDYVFITNVPSFYKINLFNDLAKRIKIKVIFISDSSVIRNEDFISRDIYFEHVVINDVPFEKRDKDKTLLKIIKDLKRISYKNLIYPGWEIIELMFLAFIIPKKKNGIVIESSILETKSTGLPWLIKRVFMSRMSKAFPSGELQKEILEKANFKGKIFETHGVGILSKNFTTAQVDLKVESAENLSYIYVGRLSAEKNVSELIDTFNNVENILYVVGEGPLSEELKNKSKKNIIFLGHVNNSELDQVYKRADVFILPSRSEPWGLVVEEALSCRLPLIISDRVGCKNDLVLALKAGIVFSLSPGGKTMLDAIHEMNLHFSSYKDVVNQIDLSQLEDKKVTVYLDAV